MKDGGKPGAAPSAAVRHEVNAAAKGLSDQAARGAGAHPCLRPGPALAVNSDLATRVLAARVPVVRSMTALGGFDTHANQVQPHERLLSFLASEPGHARKNLDAQTCGTTSSLMTYSEFRPARQAECQRRHDHAPRRNLRHGRRR